ncbi:uncharacterized protein RAG0_05912 [Rhynchosporium agropyri]|uniref:Uncharacterized protein n=1 Tax=Rhynchosporium agropyri TaxID=914238 RepID=A0A1E1KF85_9HELO|nr:uncharacterized protein RAG0_05912 [Rhynchosporium agropyri]
MTQAAMSEVSTLGIPSGGRSWKTDEAKIRSRCGQVTDHAHIPREAVK